MNTRSLWRVFREIARSKRFNLGWCPACGRRTIFVEKGAWLRETYLCVRCRSNPRWRAVIEVLERFVPRWRDLSVFESSPGGAASDKLAAECARYLPAHFFPGTPPGQFKDGIRCEDLENLTFENSSFDIVITQDVMEHVFRPENAFREIARVLRPGGLHLFTVPWQASKPTVVRAVLENGAVRHRQDPVYHGNPIDRGGSLVATDWGADMLEFIWRHSGMFTTVVSLRDRKRGIDGELCEVFISRKGASPCAAAPVAAGGGKA